MTDADQGGSEDAIEEDQNLPNSSIERKKSDASYEVGRDPRYIYQNYNKVNDHHSRNTKLVDFKIRVRL